MPPRSYWATTLDVQSHKWRGIRPQVKSPYSCRCRRNATEKPLWAPRGRLHPPCCWSPRYRLWLCSSVDWQAGAIKRMLMEKVVTHLAVTLYVNLAQCSPLSLPPCFHQASGAQWMLPSFLWQYHIKSPPPHIAQWYPVWTRFLQKEEIVDQIFTHKEHAITIKVPSFIIYPQRWDCSPPQRWQIHPWCELGQQTPWSGLLHAALGSSPQTLGHFPLAHSHWIWSLQT